MNFLKKFVKWTIIIVTAVILLTYMSVFLAHKLIWKETVATEPTVAGLEAGDIKLGVHYQEQTGKLDDYIYVLAEQIANYNKIARDLWPDNAVADQYFLAESIEGGDFWMISPTGEVTKMTKKEALQRYSFGRQPYRIGFGPLEGIEDPSIKGMYGALSEVDLNNYLMFESYPYLGTYDAFITYSHELFHMLEQPKWDSPDHIYNAGRSERFGDLDARAQRYLMNKQFLEAVAAPIEDKILAAVVSWENYKVQHNEDYLNATYFDRVEGTAHYLEIVSCLYAAYPDMIQTREDLFAALALYASHPEYELEVGVVDEAYSIGALASILLDYLEVPDWQETLMADGNLTPQDILADYYASQDGIVYPDLVSVSAEDISQAQAGIDHFNETNPRRAKERIATMLYQMLF